MLPTSPTAQPPTGPQSQNKKKKREVAPDWQRDCKRNGAGFITVFVVAALAWLTGAHTLVPLSNGQIAHPSFVGWPFYVCLVGILIGVYIYEAATHERLPILGRRFMPPDHRTKYSLVFDNITIRWELYPQQPNRLGARVALKISNGGDSPIQAFLEKLDVTVNSVKAPTIGGKGVWRIRLMPHQIREFRAPLMPDIPTGAVGGEVGYRICYGPLNGAPIYRRTHKVAFSVNEVITTGNLRNGMPSFTDWSDMEEEEDTDMPEEYVPHVGD